MTTDISQTTLRRADLMSGQLALLHWAASIS